MDNRCSKLLDLLDQNGLDAILIADPVNCRYFSGFTGGEATLLICPKAKLLFTDFRYTIQAVQEAGPLFSVIETQRSNSEQLLKDALSSFDIKRVGFEEETVSVALFQSWQSFGCTFLPASHLISAIRRVKDQNEISLMQQAQKVSEQAFADILPLIRPGITEYDIATELLYRIRKHGGEGPSFDPIVASGPNGALCHAVPGNRKLQPGDFIVMDFGSKVGGYCSDMTRTVALAPVDPTLKHIYEIVLEANLAALDVLAPGISGKELDATARNIIAGYGYGAFFGHSLGHGFGLEIHEAPYAGSTSTDVLLPGTTITVEPGIYLEGQGGVRIEDCCVVTPDGKLNLVSTAKDLLIIS